MIEKLVCLAGGVGAAKFLQGLVKLVPEESVTVIVNTGDNIKLHGLHIFPDPDIVMYSLAGIADRDKGWGIEGDSFNCLEAIGKLGIETWFKLGDRDLATHIYRTYLLNSGCLPDQVTQRLCKILGVKSVILPMTNDVVTPQIITPIGKMHFEEYLVKRGAKDEVLDVVIEGAEAASPAPGVTEAIMDAGGIIVCPSNPIVSIGPILAVKGIRKALKETSTKIVAISPIVGGSTIKGPADKLMRGLGLEVSAYSVASLYRDFLDIFIFDNIDEKEKERIEKLGIEAVTTNTVMRSLEDKIGLAELAMENIRKTS